MLILDKVHMLGEPLTKVLLQDICGVPQPREHLPEGLKVKRNWAVLVYGPFEAVVAGMGYARGLRNPFLDTQQLRVLACSLGRR